jgi:hypothetical protein
MDSIATGVVMCSSEIDASHSAAKDRVLRETDMGHPLSIIWGTLFLLELNCQRETQISAIASRSPTQQCSAGGLNGRPTVVGFGGSGPSLFALRANHLGTVPRQLCSVETELGLCRCDPNPTSRWLVFGQCLTNVHTVSNRQKGCTTENRSKEWRVWMMGKWKVGWKVWHRPVLRRGIFDPGRRGCPRAWHTSCAR